MSSSLPLLIRQWQSLDKSDLKSQFLVDHPRFVSDLVARQTQLLQQAQALWTRVQQQRARVETLQKNL